MKEWNTLEGNATIKQLQREVSPDTKGQYMKESRILAGNATNNFLIRNLLLNSKRHSMKELNIFAGNVSNNFLGRQVLINIKGQSMKDSNILAGNACRGSLTNHQWAAHDRVKYPCSQCRQQFSQKGHLARHIISLYIKKSINTENNHLFIYNQ